MGEGGEHNDLWYSAVFKMYDQMDISYCFWTLKKMNAKNSFLSFDKPSNWDMFLTNSLTKKEADICIKELINNVSYKNCDKNLTVNNHIQRRNKFITNAYAFDYKINGYYAI